MIQVRIFDGFGNIYREIDIQDNDYIIEENNIPIPRNKSFVKWIRVDDENTITFIPKLINTDFENSYYNSRLDDVDNEIKEQVNSMNVNLSSKDKELVRSNSSVNKLSDSADINKEIKLLSDSCDSNKAKLDSIDNLKLDEQLTKANSEIETFQSKLETMNINHMNELQGISEGIENNEKLIEQIKQNFSNIPKHVILTETEYKSIADPDENIIYFTKEN